MDLFAQIGRALGAVCRLLGFGGATAGAPAVTEETASIRSADGTAVAGFVLRPYVDRFFLAARLASVAKLNVPAGRKPRVASRRSPGQPAIPRERLGAKKTRLNGTKGPRVLTAKASIPSKTGDIVMFPARPKTAVEAGAALARAA
jgi:hypothetical protein